MTSRSTIRRRAIALRRGDERIDCSPVVETVGRHLRSGSSLSAACRAAARVHPQQWCREMIRRLDHGASLSVAAEARLTDEMGRRRPDADLVLTLQVIAMAAQVGGESTRHIDALSDTLRVRRRAAADRLTQASTAIASIRLLTWLPIVCALWMVVDDPAVRSVLVSTPIGWICLATGATFNLLGRHWTAHLVQRT